MPRYFRALPGRTVTLPQDLRAGPGATNMRLDPGCVVTLDDDACIRHQRFVNGRKNAGDWEELAELPAAAAEPRSVSHPDAAPTKPFGLPMHGAPVPTKKEG